MCQVQNKLILTIFCKISTFYGLLQLLACHIDIIGNIFEFVIGINMNAIMKVAASKTMNTRRDLVKIGGVALCKEEEKQNRKRYKHDQEKVQVPNRINKMT